MKWLAEFNAKGLPVFGQAASVRAPFVINFQDWNLFDDSAAWREAMLGTVEEKKAKLAKPEFCQAVRAEYDAGTPTRDFIFGELHKYIAQKIVRPKKIFNLAVTLLVLWPAVTYAKGSENQSGRTSAGIRDSYRWILTRNQKKSN